MSPLSYADPPLRDEGVKVFNGENHTLIETTPKLPRPVENCPVYYWVLLR